MALPATFGKYFLTEKIATGGMAEIYRGKLFGPGGFEKQLVIKQIHPSLARRPEFVDMFVAEAKTTVSLTHGNIVPVYELGVVDGTYFLAMEYVDGPTLAELLLAADGRGQRLGAGASAHVAAEILKGLDYAHRKATGVIHRDLSTRNVIVSRDGEVKIVDFGLAATLEGAATASAATSGDGRPVGSFPYMSPEQARHEPLDPRTDLFTCGILLWEMLTGSALFARSDDDQTLRAVLEAEVPPPSRRAPEVPTELDAICLRALARDREERYATAAAFLGALGRFLYSVNPPVTSAAISRLVSQLCPDVPRAEAGASRRSPASESHSHEPVTKPMERPQAEKILATHVEFKKILTRATGSVPALREPVRPPVAASSRRVRPVLVVSGLLAAAVTATFWISRRERTSSLPAARPPAADAAVVAVDSTPAPADAAPPRPDGAPPLRPVPKGRLTVGIDGADWAEVYLDGKKVGRVPYQADVPAGKHRLRIVCLPDICPPNGVTKEREITVPPGDELREIFTI